MSLTLSEERGALFARLQGHARQGLSKAEACDIEGTDPTTARMALQGTKLKWGPPAVRGQTKRLGLEQTETIRLAAALDAKLKKLRETHSAYEVSKLTGLTKTEQKACMRSERHNWTLAQLTRTANALDISLLDLVEEAVITARKEKDIGKFT